MWGGGGGVIFEPKTLSMYKKEENKKGGVEGQYLNLKPYQCIKKKKQKQKMTEPGLEPTTSGLEKPALLSIRLNTIIAITKYE